MKAIDVGKCNVKEFEIALCEVAPAFPLHHAVLLSLAALITLPVLFNIIIIANTMFIIYFVSLLLLRRWLLLCACGCVIKWIQRVQVGVTMTMIRNLVSNLNFYYKKKYFFVCREVLSCKKSEFLTNFIHDERG